MTTIEGSVIRLPDHLSEEWRPVPGTDGAYEVSSLGRLRSWINTRRVRQDEPKIMNPTIGKRGYRVWCHRLSGKEQRLTVHRTVALAFHGDPGPGRWEVRHLDNDELNNQASNLAWGTPAENAADRVRAGTTNAGERSPFAKLTWKEVRSLRSECHAMSVEVLAHKYGVTRESVRRVINNETWRDQS